MGDGKDSDFAGRRAATALLCAALLAGCGDDPKALLASAKDYLARNDTNAAVIELKNALQKDGNLAEARFLLGRVNLAQGNVPGAIKELRRAREKGYPETEVAPLLARALVLAGEFDAVLKEFDGTSIDDPKARAALLGAVGSAHLGKGDFDKAKSSYELAVAAAPDDAAARVGLGRLKLIGGDTAGAMAEADRALAGQSDAAEAHALRAEVFTLRKQTDSAIVALEAAIAARPDSVNYRFALISMLLRERRVEPAKAHLATMRQLAPTHPSTRYLQALMALRTGTIAEARDHIAESIRLAPGFLPARLLGGVIYLRLNQHPLAQEHLGVALAHSPKQPLARRLLAASLLATGQPVRALETLQPLLEARSVDTATLNLAGRILAAKGDYDAAADHFARVVSVEPDNAAARTRLGLSRLIGGDSARALADLEAASDLETDSGQADVALVLAHLRRGELDKAATAVRQLEGKQPAEPQTHMLKGGVLLARKDPSGARAAFEKALSVKPDYVAAAAQLARRDLDEGRPNEARKRLESFVAAHPKNVEGQLLLADLLTNTGAKSEEIVAVLGRAVKGNPTLIAPRAALARHYLAVKEPKKGLAVAQELAAAHPDSPIALGVLARAQLDSGDRQQAISSLNKISGLLPQVPSSLIELSGLQRLAGDRGGEERSLRRALELQPRAFDAQQRLIALLLDEKRSDEALAFARRLQQQQPKAALGQAFEGDIHAASARWDSAAQAYRKALTLAPAAPIAAKLHAALLRAGKSVEAETHASSWLRSHPDDIVLRSYLAERALAERRLDDAEKLYRKLDEIGPNNALVLNNLAWLAGQRHDPGAVALARRAQALAPNNPAILDTLGMLQVDYGEREAGFDNLRRAVELSSGAAPLRLNLAKAYAKAGRRDDALDELDRVLKQAPEGGPLRAEAAALKRGL